MVKIRGFLKKAPSVIAAVEEVVDSFIDKFPWFTGHVVLLFTFKGG